jgi:hypothetical protein
MTHKIQVVLADPLWDYLQRRKPVSLSVSAFCASLIERGLELTPADRAVLAETLDTAATLEILDRRERISFLESKKEELSKAINTRKGGAGGKTKPFEKRALDPALVPDDLAQVRDELVEFWSVKKGTRSENAYKRLCTKLRGLTPEDQRKALTEASDAGWATIYEPKAPQASRKPWEAPEQPHPASRVFTAADFEPPATNPLLENLF